jgi:PadR family transcriptional regulator PadR
MHLDARKSSNSGRGAVSEADQGQSEPDGPAASDTAGAQETAERTEAFGWPPRDFLAPFVLLAVSMERAHGYVIEDFLSSLGLFGITMSTLYRTLRQMEKEGYLLSSWEPGPTGPARRVYSLTDAGRAWLDASAAMLTAYRDTIDRFFGLYGAAGPASTRPAARGEAGTDKESDG